MQQTKTHLDLCLFPSIISFDGHIVQRYTWRAGYLFPKFVGRYITSWLLPSLHIFSSLMNWLHLGLPPRVRVLGETFSGGSFGVFFKKKGGGVVHQIVAVDQKFWTPPKMDFSKACTPNWDPPTCCASLTQKRCYFAKFWMLFKGVETTKELLVSSCFCILFQMPIPNFYDTDILYEMIREMKIWTKQNNPTGPYCKASPQKDLKPSY